MITEFACDWVLEKEVTVICCARRFRLNMSVIQFKRSHSALPIQRDAFSNFINLKSNDAGRKTIQISYTTKRDTSKTITTLSTKCRDIKHIGTQTAIREIQKRIKWPPNFRHP
eukprot:NODE_744_length_4265_cov_0.973116.p4 type:complete len:113 gc:universal NODE_744_length_4265_cov_0.973116:1522-1860(+)